MCRKVGASTGSAILFLGVVLSLFLIPTEVPAWHGGFTSTTDCSKCHDVSSSGGDNNTSYIARSNYFLQGIKAATTLNVTPAILGCTVCHSAPGNPTIMKNAFSSLTSGASVHPVDLPYSISDTTHRTITTDWTDANQGKNIYLSNWDNTAASIANLPSYLTSRIACVDCHDVSIGGGSYPNHGKLYSDCNGTAIQIGEVRSTNPYMLRGVVAGTPGNPWTGSSLVGNAPNDFCMNCHSNSALNLSRNFRMGHYGWGALTVATENAIIREPSGTALKVSKCVDCHETHTSRTNSNLMGGLTSQINSQSTNLIDETNCTAVCHSDTAFNATVHKTTTKATMTCASCHNTGGSHRDATNPRRLSGVADTDNSGILINMSATGRDQNYDGIIGNESSVAYSYESTCRTCHSDHAGHAGIIAGAASHYGRASCLDCHEPHGKGVFNGTDNNTHMIRNMIAGENTVYRTSADTWTASNTAICNNLACHGKNMGDNTLAPGTIMGDVSAHSGVTYTTDCSTCHPHTSAGGSFMIDTSTMACFACHGGAETAGGRPSPNPQVANKINQTQYTTFGHGATSTYAGSGDNGAGFAQNDGCYYCHDENANHTSGIDNTVDPYRLGAYAQNINGLCNKCHAIGASDPNAAHGTNLIDNGVHGKMNLSSSKTWPGNYDYKCVDCHDPHGDNNYQMIRYNINAPTASNDANSGSNNFGTPKRLTPFDCVTFTNFTGFAAGSYAISGSAVGQRGICEVCHNQTGKYTRAADNVGSHAALTGDCIACHSHDKSFKPAGCNGCHGDISSLTRNDNTAYPPNGPKNGVGGFAGTSWAEDNVTPAARGDHRKHAGARAADNVGTVAFAKDCAKCHIAGYGSDAAHNTSKANATMSAIVANSLGTWNQGTNVGRTSVVDDYCTNVSCHSPYSAAENPSNIYKSGTPFTSGANSYRRYWLDNVSWDCYTCHAYNGTTATSRPVTGVVGDNTMRSASHASHIDNAVSSCRDCHPATLAYTTRHKSGSVNVGFDNAVIVVPLAKYDNAVAMIPTDNLGANRKWTTCSNVYCHSTVQTQGTLTARTYSLPIWGNASSAICGSCHLGNGITDNTLSLMATGSHRIHDNSTYNIGCTICHPYAGALNDNHANGRIEVVMSGTWTYGTGGRNITPIDGLYDNVSGGAITLDNLYAVVGADNFYGQCSALKCHNNGRALAPMVIPVWGGTDTTCTYCHRGDATSGTPWIDNVSYAGDNNHTAHSSFACGSCHAGTVSTANNRVITGYDNHLNGSATVVFSAGGTYNTGTKACSGTSCHGTPTPLPEWDNLATVDGCFACHKGAESGMRPVATVDGIANKIDNTQWTSFGHGNMTTVTGSTDNGAKFVANSGDCYLCHAIAAAHVPKSASDPYRLGADNQNVNGLCNRCHITGSSDGHKPTNVSNFLDNGIHGKFITGSARTWPGSYDYKCVDCHDPHGDNNWQMVKYTLNAPTASNDTNAGSDTYGTPKRTTTTSNVTFTSFTGFAAGSYAISGTTTYGICEVCHTQTSFYSRSLDNTVATTHAGLTGDCMACHSHDTGFKGAGCEGCHAAGNTVSAPVVVIGTNSHTKTNRATNATGCAVCHAGHSGAPVTIPLPSSNWTLGTGQTHVVANMRTALGINYTTAGHTGIQLGGTGTTGTTEADICWNCHATVSASTSPVNAGDHYGVSEWGRNKKTAPTGFPLTTLIVTDNSGSSIGDSNTLLGYNYGYLMSSNKTGKISDWTATGAWIKHGYLDRASRPVTSTHSANAVDGATHSSSVVSNVNWTTSQVKRGSLTGTYTRDSGTITLDAKANIRCSYCHDVHGLHRSANGTTVTSLGGTPATDLRGTWIGNPYGADVPPIIGDVFTSNFVGTTNFRGPTPRMRSDRQGSRNRGGFFIDQNSSNPSANGSMSSVALTASLCTTCHGTIVDSMNFYNSGTNDNMWRGPNGHSNAVLGGTGTNKINLFDARRPTITGVGTAYNYMTQQGKAGTSRFLEGGTANANVPLFNGDHIGTLMRSGWYSSSPWTSTTSTTGTSDWTNWYGTGTSTTIGAYNGAGGRAHNFLCSKCHSPHASTLPALLITDCLDTGATGGAGIPTWTLGPYAKPNIPQSNDCHRKTSTGTGWHRLDANQ